MKLSKTYEPQQYETDIYDLWEKSGAFAPKQGNKNDSFSTIMPPPNANGNLHIGHALDIAIKDTVVRYQRMMGKNTLFLPGADHAGFETWVVFEKQLNTEGKSRFDYSREDLYGLVWDFVELNRTNLTNQFRKLGASVDWSRFTFSLDDKVVKTAYQTFKKLWDDGYIYRGERLVNFCTTHGTAFSDIEVEYNDVKGHIWEIEYPLTDGSGSIVVATTRPETMLGDTAIAVSNHDERYKKYIGKTAHVPLTNREIPIIVDAMVDPNFGTGAVKITPAHDPNDFEAGIRHDLPRISIIDHEGKITHEAPEKYIGLTVDQGREAVLKDLEKAKKLVSAKDYNHSVGHCYKCKTILQPLIRDQWFIAMTKLVKPAIKALKANEIEFMPTSKQDIIIKYLKNIRDWNISRQIAWGIPIPAFQNIDNPDDWIFNEGVDQETIVIDNKTYRRDPDVFDTWFSSSQWPFVTLGDLNSADYKQFYPNNLMETGVDILQQWVSRMIVMGIYITGKIPFETVYFHGMVLDPHGKKMSKSKGNVVNPLTISDVYGTDALRLGLLTGTSPGNNQPFEESKVVGARNFCNKLWNIARYSEGLFGDDFIISHNPKPASLADHWILAKLNNVINNINTNLDQYKVGEAYSYLYKFIWDELADWYIEASKSEPNYQLLAYVLEKSLKIAHPFAPFVTETIWQTLSWNSQSNLITEMWPTNIVSFDTKKAAAFEDIIDIVVEARYISTSVGVKYPTLYFTPNKFINDNATLIAKLAKLKSCHEVEAGRGMHLTKTKINCWLDIDLKTARAYVFKLNQQKHDHEVSIARLQGRLNDKKYTSKAPKHIVDQTKEQLLLEQELLSKIHSELETFQSFAS